MKYNLLSLVILMPFLAFGADFSVQEIKVSALPLLGEELGQLPESRTRIMASSANFIPSYIITVASVKYTIGVEGEECRVVYILTSSEKAMTEEGCYPGMQLKELSGYFSDSVIHERGWAKYLLLPSGWGAAFHFDEEVTEDSKVLYLFRRLRERRLKSQQGEVANSYYAPLVPRSTSSE